VERVFVHLNLFIMKSFNFTDNQIILLKEAIEVYCEHCMELCMVDKMTEMDIIYNILSPSRFNLNTTEDCTTHPICDY
jgi:hypothetical protein